MLSLPVAPFLRYNPKLPRRAVDPRELSVCTNAEILSGGVVKSGGWSLLSAIATIEPVRHMAEHITNDGTHFICILTATSFYAYNTSTGDFTDYTRVAADPDTKDPYSISYLWSSCSYGNLFIFTNGVDPVQSWDAATTGNADDLSSMTYRPQLVMTFGAHLILACDNAAVNTVERKAIYWSTVGDPTDFPMTGSSGMLYVYEGKGGIKGISTLTRDTIAVYKTDSFHLIEYVAAPQYFVTRSSISGTGLDAQNAIAQIGSEHAVLTNGGLKKYDGSSMTPFAPEIDPIITQYYPNNNAKYASLVYNGYDNKLWIFLPQAGADWLSNIALVYSYKDASWSIQSGFSTYAVCAANIAAEPGARWVDFPIAWNSTAASTIFWGSSGNSFRPRLLLGDTITSVYQEDGITTTRHGEAYQATFETTMINPGFLLFQQPTVNTELVQVDVGIDTGNPQVSIGVSDRGDESITWYGPFTPDANGRVYTTIVGRWFIFRVQDTAAFSVCAVTPWFVKRGVL